MDRLADVLLLILLSLIGFKCIWTAYCSAASACDTANLTCKCKTQSLAMMKKYLRWKAEWLYGIPHGSINWALVPACPSKIGKDLACPACWCVFLLCFLKCFWAARSCSDVWLSFRSFGGTGTTDDNPWKQPRWNKQCGLEWFDYLIACASTNKRVKFFDFCLWRCYSVFPLCGLWQKRLHNSCLCSLWSTQQVDTKVVLGFIGTCRDLVCWTIVFVCFHGLVLCALVLCLS